MPPNPKMDLDSISVDSKGYESGLKANSEISHPNSPTEKNKRANSGSSFSIRSSTAGRSASAKAALSAKSRPPSAKVQNANSNIPLPVKGSAAKESAAPTPMMSRASIRSKNTPSRLTNSGVANKHTLEVQFINKKKRLVQMSKEMADKQKPIIDLYQNLVLIKSKLEQLGRHVELEEIKVIPFKGEEKICEEGAGETVTPDTVAGMKTSIEEIPKTLMEICQNLLSRRAVIVDLLESVAKSEVDVSEMSDKIEALKTEGGELQKSLDAIICEHEKKINELAQNWQQLLNQKQVEVDNHKIEDLQAKIKDQERLAFESQMMINDLQKKLEEKRYSHDKSVSELENVIKELRDKIQKMEQELENERKTTQDQKTRNNSNNHAIKSLRTKVSDLESKVKEAEDKSTELNKKVKYAQDALKNKESQWQKEKDELSKKVKEQEQLLHRLQNDKTEFESRYRAVEGEKEHVEDELRFQIQTLQEDLKEAQEKAETLQMEKEELEQKFNDIQEHMTRMGMECKQKMEKVTYSIDWGKEQPGSEKQLDAYAEMLSKEVRIRELEDKVKELEVQRDEMIKNKAAAEPEEKLTDEEHKRLLVQQKDCISHYQRLLQDSEDRLSEKTMEVARLNNEISHLRMRQDALEEQSRNCPTMELQKMIEEGRAKLSELMKKSMESEQKIAHYETVIQKQNRQMLEMENLLRYRENMSGVMKASRDELLIEKESLTRYTQEMRTALAELTRESKLKDRLIKELQEKMDLRVKQISKLEQDVKELESNLQMTNEKRFKLQETIGSMEKELQSTKAHVHHLNDIQTRAARSKIRDEFR